MKPVSCLLAMLWPLITLYAQSPRATAAASSLYINKFLSPAPLQLGQTCPDVDITFKGFRKEQFNLSETRGRLVILDFWATTCSACIPLLQRLDSLEKQFAGKLLVIPVSYQKEATVTSFLQNNKRLKGLNLSSVTDDSVLSKIFPHTMIPHEVWIGPDGKWLYATSHTYVTAANIKAVLDGTPPVMPQKRDVLQYDVTRPLLLYGNGGADTAFGYRSIITLYLDGLPRDCGIQCLDNYTRLFAVNYSVPELYNLAVPEMNTLTPNRVVIHFRDSSRYQFTGSATDWDTWQYTGLFCYDLLLPANTDIHTGDYMLQDLNRFFGMKGGMIDTLMDCYALQCTDTKLLRHSTAKPSSDLFSERMKSIQGVPLSILVKRINLEPGMIPVIDETGFTAATDIRFDCPISDVICMNKALSAYGLRLYPCKRKLRVFVLRDE